MDPNRPTEKAQEAVRAAQGLAQRAGHSQIEQPEVVEILCRAAVDAVRGHGGMTALWTAEARRAASTALDEMSSEHGDEVAWRRIARRHAEP